MVELHEVRHLVRHDVVGQFRRHMDQAPREADDARLGAQAPLGARVRNNDARRVAPGAFRPAPKVDSAFVRMEPRPEPLKIDDDLLRRAFSARRKTLRNALPGLDFAAAGVDAGLRPENLSPEDYARLSMNSIL